MQAVIDMQIDLNAKHKNLLFKNPINAFTIIKQAFVSCTFNSIKTKEGVIAYNTIYKRN